MSDTIVALASAPGRSGVAVVRVSGPAVLSCIQQLWGAAVTPRSFRYGCLTDKDGRKIDEGLWVLFAGPASFTGEDVLEFHGHGNPLLVDRVVARFCELGCRLAEPGEFSKRAFLNDKMDLIQAEAVADLIAAQSQQAIDMAFQSLQGVFSEQITALVDQLIALRVYLEASLDFSDEDIDFIAQGEVVERVEALLAQVSAIYVSAERGMLLQEGVRIVVLGPPNVGKSSLFNRLLGRKEAIVTDQAGTTRDVLTQSLRLGDLVVTLTDTAGLRSCTNDRIEQEGMLRAKARVEQANIVLVMLDVERFMTMSHAEFMAQVGLQPDTQVMAVVNKIDQLSADQLAALQNQADLTLLSTLDGSGMETLIGQLKQQATVLTGVESDALLARRRHLEALQVAQQALEQGLLQLKVHHAGELCAEECRVAQHALGQITGQYTNDDLLTAIFQTFCIGK